SVNTSSTVIFWGGFSINLFASKAESFIPYVFKTSPTNIRAQRVETNFIDTVLNCTVVEFNPDWVNSYQSGINTIPTLTSTVSTSVTTVNTSKSLLSYLSATGSAEADGAYAAYLTSHLDSATSVVLSRGGIPIETATSS